MSILLPLAQAAEPITRDSSYFFDRILDPEVLVFLMSTVAIVCVAATIITMAVLKHRERVERIRMGMDPDAPAGKRDS